MLMVPNGISHVDREPPAAELFSSLDSVCHFYPLTTLLQMMVPSCFVGSVQHLHADAIAAHMACELSGVSTLGSF